jgi:hypothetical protein
MTMNTKQFLADVIDSWNSHDLEKILSHYSDDFELTSPGIKNILGIDSGTLKDKTNVRKWWRRVLDKVPDLRFELIDIAESADSIAMIYKSSHNNKIVASIFHFNEDEKIKKEIFYQ